MLSSFSYVCWPSVCLWRNVYLGLLPIFGTACFSEHLILIYFGEENIAQQLKGQTLLGKRLFFFQMLALALCNCVTLDKLLISVLLFPYL